MSAESIDYNSLMQANLKRVFGERDASRRMKAIAELYADDAVLYEPPDASAAGHAAINQAVEALLSSLPAKLRLHCDWPRRRPPRSRAVALAIRSAEWSRGRDRNRCCPD